VCAGLILTEKLIDFNCLEKEIFTECHKLGCETLKKILQAYDRELMKARDKKQYRHKGHHKTVIKTVMGEVEYSRAVCEMINEDCTKSYVYLLDEAMGIKGSGFMSGLLSGQIAEAVCAGTYRRAAQSISEMTGQRISHQAAWNVTQQLGAGIEKQEERLAALAAKNEGAGQQITKILFEEKDGIWLHLQGKDRKKYGRSHEMKVSIAYDGAEPIGKKRYRLTNKVATANFESAGKFHKRKEGIIADTYNIDEIEKRIVNGDGANWIKQYGLDDTAYFQLDTFHRNKAIVKAAPDENARKAMFKLLYSKNLDDLLMYIDALANSVEDEDQEEKLRVLYTYFTNNREGLISYKRRGLDLPEAPEGKEYRGMGAMESNIFTIIGNRMKGGRACWSVDGGNNLARLLTLKHTGKLHAALNNITNWMLPERYAEEVTMTSSKAPKYDGNGYEPPHTGAFPATPDFKFLRDFGRIDNVFA
jgi:hypothetical protein